MGLGLRRAELVDLPAVVGLMNLAFRGVGENASWNTEGGYIEGDRTSEALLTEELATKPGSFLLVVDGEVGASLRGCVWLEPVSEGIWYLGSLTVDPRLQKGGLGRELLAAAEEFAVERGARVIEMKVIHVRDTLIAWYERRGYRLTGEVHAFPYGDNRFGVPMRDDLEFVVLEKRLG